MILKNFKDELNKEEPTFARDIKRRIYRVEFMDFSIDSRSWYGGSWYGAVMFVENSDHEERLWKRKR
ncbi:MAG: hypothetical protein DRN18_03155 [Thermoplasmata archaeon]|nr:MAG: hypothetical protein DRN18_03155 [Thermoplasmata archaeon]